MPKFRVAICGGGISGLTLAIALSRYAPPDSPIAVDIYEADKEVRTVGAGITVWPRTWAVMRHLDLYEDLSRVAVQPESSGKTEDQYLNTQFRPAFVARKGNQSSEGYTYAYVLAPSGSATMHRKDMIDVFLRHLPSSYRLHTSKRLVKYTTLEGVSGSPVTLHFADGTTAEADLLVGADGIHSATRMRMYELAHNSECATSGSSASMAVPLEECTRCAAALPTWTGVFAYRSLIPTEKLYSLNPTHTTANIGAVLCYSGKGTHIITYQISGGKFLNFVVPYRVPGGEDSPYPGKWVTDVPREEVVTKLEGWEPEVQQMLECVESPSRWAVHVVDKLPFAVSSNVALLGDAMHAMPPNFGAGGGQSIEDAYILGRLLADRRVSVAHMPAVLRIYEDIRLPFANDISRRAREVGLMYEFNAPGFYGCATAAVTDGHTDVDGKLEQAQETERLDQLGEAIQKMWEWQWTEGIDMQWAQAERRLAALVEGAERG
ncbi:FAD/NAD-P-binding domain-containing protein [Fomes fomentarius]|nr:FAD/NAD-P-binding domain-containing protein [Fomes fomentarius]